MRNHLRAARAGLVTARRARINLGRSVHVWQTEIVDETGKPVCVSRLTLYILDRSLKAAANPEPADGYTRPPSRGFNDVTRYAFSSRSARAADKRVRSPCRTSIRARRHAAGASAGDPDGRNGKKKDETEKKP